MRYVNVISNGDAKTHQHFSSINVYGEIKITKEECINHIANILGTDLHKKVAEWCSKRVSVDGRKKGSLKEYTIIKLRNFYRKST